MSKLTKIVLIVLGGLLALTILIAVITNNKTEETFEYDLSMFNEVNVSDVIQMFESGDTYVLFIGREDCEVCAHVIPGLKEAQRKNNLTVQYLDIKEALNDYYFIQLCDLLNMESTQTVTEDGSGDKETNTYGYFLSNYGMTPTIIIIKDGKQTGGHIGGAKTEEIVNWITDKVK